MHIACYRALRLRLAKHIGIARIEALDSRALVAGNEGRDKMLAHAEHEHVTIEWRPVFLTHHHDLILLRDRMLTTAGHEELIVEDAIVFVRHLLQHQVLILGAGHHH